MFNFLTDKKNKPTAIELAGKILFLLEKELPDVLENHKHWSTTLTVDTDKNEIKYYYSSKEVEYVESNLKKHKKSYKVTGLNIFYNDTQAYEPVKIDIQSDLIFSIQLRTKHLYKIIDVNKIEKLNLNIEEIFQKNSDKNILSKILKNKGILELDALEIDDTFEIEIENKKYYTILDMEDGNYIAVNKKGQIFRIHHDNEVQAKLINNSIQDFLENYVGNKATLAYLFN